VDFHLALAKLLADPAELWVGPIKNSPAHPE
jgi:hypothetical protein